MSEEPWAPEEEEEPDSEFEQYVLEALEALPEPFRSGIKNVEIIIADRPTLRQRKAVRWSRRVLLGLYEGIPLPKRSSTGYGAVEPDRITLFRLALRRANPDPEQLRREVRHTLYHEIAHHFGIDDDRLLELGAY